ncbi:MAG TPA: amidohydrolase family protein [Caulobacteraceae bacterium]|jgi:predicted TIM-barrel fold metal-dependent hydrolase|nr:amidohydrolase family protein [Caulobacteraceae bacterium]
MSEGDGNGRCACGRVDVHAHFLPDVYAQALAGAGLTTLDGGFPVPKWSAEAALETMDRLEIATAIVSLSSPSSHFLPSPERPALVAKVNDAGAELMGAYPGRFGYFATLPMPDVEASLAELRRALDQLGADGVVLQTNTDGIYLGAPAFAPILAELNRRQATLFLHPTSPACFEAIGLGRPAPLLEFPLDTTRTIVDLLYSRGLQTNPDIKLIVPHGGAALPALIARIAAFANLPFIEPRPASEAEVFETLERLYYDVALSAHPVPFAALRRIAPMTQILFGSDWPFTPEAGVARNLHQLGQNGLNEADARAIARENAERVFPRLAQTQGAA